jgi:transposase
MIGFAPGTKVWLAAGRTDMRKGFDGLSALSATVLREDPLSGHVFVFRGRLGDRVKVLWWDGQGMCLFYKRLEKASFVWPSADDGKVGVTPAQLASLLEGIDWRLTRALAKPVMPTRVS